MKKLCISLLALITLLTINCFADGWYFDGANWKFETRDGDYISGEIKKSNGVSYYLDDDGNMATDYLAEVNDNLYYFDSNGVMVTNTWVALDPSMIEDQPFDATAYFMYFQNNGKAVKGEDGKKRTIDGKTYMFNDRGIMMVGWLNANGEYLDNEDSDDWYSSEAMYYAREDGSLAEGWLPLSDYQLEEDITNAAGDYLNLETIWFYFDPSTHKKNTNEKSINGRKYNFFSDNGRMMTNWEQLEMDSSFIATSSNNRYYGDYNDGSLKKNEWIYAIPSSVIDSEAYNDYEYNWFYAKNNGSLTTDIRKKINNKYYLFDKKGIMKTGLIIFYQGKYWCAVDLERTTFEDFTKLKKFYAVDDEVEIMGTNGPFIRRGIDGDPDCYYDFIILKEYKYNNRCDLSIKYFGDDGSERYGSSMISFADGDYEFCSDTKGGFIEMKNDKYYLNGFPMKAYGESKYGLVLDICLPTGNYGSHPTTENRFDPKLTTYGTGMLPAAAQQLFNINDYPEWMINMPVGYMFYAKGKTYTKDNHKTILNEITGVSSPEISDPERPNGLSGHTGTVMYMADDKGKIMKKGVYKDGGIYWIVDKNKLPIGHFNVPVKWGTKKQTNLSTGETKTYEWPYYKSDKLTYKENGDEVWKMNTWIPFLEKDAYGNTEIDYVEKYTDDECLNFLFGTYNPMG